MSLLIKALEQAAKERDSARVEPTGKNSASESGVAAGSPGNVTPLSLDSGSQRRTASSLTGLAQIEAQQRARAATVVQAGERRTDKILNYLRASPVAMLGTLAGVFALGFGIYVYLQIANPGLLARQPAAQTAPPPGPPAAPPPATAAATPEPTPAAAAAASAPVSEEGARAAAAAAGSIATPPPPAASASQVPIPTGAVVPSTGAVDRPPTTLRELAAARETAPPREAAAPARSAAAAAEPTRRAPPTADRAPRERITVSTGTARPSLNPSLTQAYASLQSGDLEQARTLYARVNQAEPLNIDALLGLAFIAGQENRNDDAVKHYLRILQLDPRHAVAQGAMIGLMGRADPVAAESRLKELIAREPSPFLHFVLGNLYADQTLWSQAQKSYFQAHHLEPENADYVYNLAIGLDHLRQSKLALGYYRRAEQLAAARGRANFNVSHARERIRSLSSQLE